MSELKRLSVESARRDVRNLRQKAQQLDDSWENGSDELLAQANSIEQWISEQERN